MYLDLRSVVLLVIHIHSLSGHSFSGDQEHVVRMQNNSQRPGVMVSFEQRIVSGHFFLGFHGWEKINRKYGVSNITYIVRIHFDRWRYRHNRLKKAYHRFWIPGALWVEKFDVGKNFYSRKFNHTRSRSTSSIDIWVEPQCFLRNHGISRIYRVTRSLRMHVYNLRWMAKLEFPPDYYDQKELKQFGKFLTQVVGISCSWLHPSTEESYSMLVKFDADRVRGKKFFSPEGYHNWDDLNDEYQVRNIGYLRGWNRAILDFSSGLHCKESTNEVGLRYKRTFGISAVYRDEYQNCRLTFRILVKFNRRHMTPLSIHHYNDWSSLNYMYGVVNISYHQDQRLIAHLEFEPGLYTNHQMKAIRSEYLKLHGILFAWVEGVYPEDKTRMLIKFQLGSKLENYTAWHILNTKYFTQVLYIDHNADEATLELPQGRYSPENIAEIYQEYEYLPRVVSVRSRPFHHGGKHVSAKSGISALRRTIWVEVEEEKDKKDKKALGAQGLSRYTPIYHKSKDKNEDTLWEDHCDLH